VGGPACPVIAKRSNDLDDQALTRILPPKPKNAPIINAVRKKYFDPREGAAQVQGGRGRRRGGVAREALKAANGARGLRAILEEDHAGYGTTCPPSRGSRVAVILSRTFLEVEVFSGSCFDDRGFLRGAAGMRVSA